MKPLIAASAQPVAAALLAIASLTPVIPTKAQDAFALAVAGGYVSDRLGAEGRDLVAQIGVIGENLIGQAGEEARRTGRELLAELQKILDETGAKLIAQGKDAADDIIRNAMLQLEALRAHAVTDLAGIVRQVDCSLTRLVSDQLPVALGFLGGGDVTIPAQWETDVPKVQPWVGPLGWTRTSVTIEFVNDRETMYEQAEDALLVFVDDRFVTEDTMVDDMVDTWELLSAMAYMAACSMPGNEDEMLRKFADYKAQADLWKRAMPPLDNRRRPAR